MKIIYAAGDRNSSYDLLKRFLINQNNHNIKIAAYASSIRNDFADWNLDACILEPKRKSFDFTSNNFFLLKQEIANFKPDLVISDVEPFVSQVALELGYPLWQVSPFLLFNGIESPKLNIWKRYSAALKGNLENMYTCKALIEHSDRKIVLSHLGDLEDPPILKKGYEWARPSYETVQSPSLTIQANPITLADYYYGEIKHNLTIDFTDPVSILTGYYNVHYNISNKYFNTNINDNIDFFSTMLESM